jgi:hypothetical protein
MTSDCDCRNSNRCDSAIDAKTDPPVGPFLA